MNNVKTFIYSLIDPFDNNIKYVGRTSSIERRTRQHYSQNHNERLHSWLLSLSEKDVKPVVSIIEECDNKQIAIEREAYWIHFYAQQGIIFNIKAIKNSTQHTKNKYPNANKHVITVSLDLEVIKALKKTAKNNYSQYVNQILRQIFSLPKPPDESDIYIRSIVRDELQKARTQGVEL